jgi:hypothetical protein
MKTTVGGYFDGGSSAERKLPSSTSAIRGRTRVRAVRRGYEGSTFIDSRPPKKARLRRFDGANNASSHDLAKYV